MSARYDFEHISRFFDDYGEREWERLEANPEGRASFHLHRRYLERYVKAGDGVLEVGARPPVRFRYFIWLRIIWSRSMRCRRCWALRCLPADTFRTRNMLGRLSI